MQILLRLKFLYPNKFNSIYKTEEDLIRSAQIWTISLQSISDKIIHSAFDMCIDRFVWPPEISEFKQLCLSITGSSLIPWSNDVLRFDKPKNEVRTNESVERLINEGAKVCKLLKEIHPSLTWYQIADKFTELKIKTKIYHKEGNVLEHVIALTKYSLQDVLDALG